LTSNTFDDIISISKEREVKEMRDFINGVLFMIGLIVFFGIGGYIELYL